MGRYFVNTLERGKFTSMDTVVTFLKPVLRMIPRGEYEESGGMDHAATLGAKKEGGTSPAFGSPSFL